MARKSGKTRTSIQQEYYKQRSRISRSIKRMEKQGYIFPEFSMPSVPKKITKSSISRLQKITPKSLREKYGLAINEATGEAKPAQEEFNRRRIQSAKQSPKTRERNKAQQFNDEYFPTKTNIVLNNFADQAQSMVGGKEYLQGLLEMIDPVKNEELIDRKSYYSRSRRAKDKSNKAARTVASLIERIIRNKQSNKVAYNIIQNGDNFRLQNAIDRMLYSYEAEEVSAALSEVISLLTNNGKLTSQDYFELSNADTSDDDGYDYD